MALHLNVGIVQMYFKLKYEYEDIYAIESPTLEYFKTLPMTLVEKFSITLNDFARSG